MKTLPSLRGLLVALFLTSLGTAFGAAESRVYVEFKPGQKGQAQALIRAAGGRVHHEFDSLNAVATTVPEAAVAALQKNPNIVAVEEDPPRYLFGCSLPVETFPYGLDAVQATTVWDSNDDGALDTGAPTGAGIKVGVIDSGVFTGHSDFRYMDQDGVEHLVPMDGYPAGWNTDGLGHGTHVTGTIVAALNGSGVTGVAPGVSIFMVKVFGDDGAWIYSSSLLDAAQRCQQAGCNIISMSLGGGQKNRFEESGLKSIANNNVLLIAAAGNDGNTTTSYPAGYASVVSVAAVDSANALASFSQRNSDVELAAPGVGVLSTVPFCEENTVTVRAGTKSGHHMEFAGRGTVTGPLVDGGLATAINPDWSGKVVLVERGSISFLDKVLNVQNSGGLAAVIYNNTAGELFGTLGTGNSSTLPAIGITQADGQALLSSIGDSATVTSSVENRTSGWEAWDGTSMATPHVSGVAALAWSAAPNKSATDVRNALTSTALDLGAAGRDSSFGFGLVQAAKAIQVLAPTSGGGGGGGGGGGVDTTAPVISNVTSTVLNAKRGTFQISWTTDDPATTRVFFLGLGYYDGSSTLSTTHSMNFNGTKGATYTYYVESADAAGNPATAGPFTHQN